MKSLAMDCCAVLVSSPFSVSFLRFVVFVVGVV